MPSGVKTNILVLGATGFIGGTILDKLLRHPDISSFRITALIRSSEKADMVEKLNFPINIVVASTDDSSSLENICANADVVFSACPAHDPRVLRGVLSGLRKRHDKTKVPCRVFQIGGTSILGDGAQGMYSSNKVYSDMDISPFLDPPHPKFKPFAFLAEELVKADNEGYVKTYLIPVPLAYGLVRNTFTDAGIQNDRCWVWPMFVNAALERGKAGYVGEGENISGCVHVYDLVDLFLLLFDSPEAPHGKDGIFFAQSAEYTRKELAQAIGEGLINIGVASDSTPNSFTNEELTKYFPPFIPFALGNNCRCTSDRSYSVGWRPAYCEKEPLFENARIEVARIFKENMAAR